MKTRPYDSHFNHRISDSCPFVAANLSWLPFSSAGRSVEEQSSSRFGRPTMADSWAQINNDLDCDNDVRLSRSIRPELFLPEQPGVETGVYRSTDNGDSWTLANTGLTSTDIAGLGVNHNGHIFAATRSIMGEGGGMFRSTDDGDSWTEQNNGFTAFDANAVTFNSRGDVFAPLPAACSDRQMTAIVGLTSAAASFLSVEMFGHWPSIRETMPLPEQLVAEYFAASDPLSRCESFRTRGPAQRQRRGPETHPCEG